MIVKNLRKNLFVITLLILSVQFPMQLWALTEYYVDPDYSSGTRDGSSSAPWQSLSDSGAWDAINASLADDDVAVYFSAREYGSASPEASTSQLSILRTNTSANRLTLDGKSRYNTNDLIPSWVVHDDGSDPGATRDGGIAHQITTDDSCIYSSGISDAKQSNVTIKGFITINTGGGKCVSYLSGDNIIITDIHCSQTETASAGPNFYFQCIVHEPSHTCPESRGAKSSCFPSDNIEWSYLKVDGGYGEGLYHCGCYNQTDAACIAGHTNVWIHHNIMIDPCLRCPSDEANGDGLEVKAAVSSVTIEDNEIYWERQAPDDYTMSFGIIINSSSIVRRNYIHDMPGAAIMLNETPDAVVGFRNASQTLLVDNVLVNNGRRSIGGWIHGIMVNYESGDDDWDNVRIANNVIHHNRGHGIYIGHTTVTSGFFVHNNILSQNEGVELRVPNPVLAGHDYNLYFDTSGNVYNYNGTTVAYDEDITAEEANSINNDNPDFRNPSAPYAADNFKLQAGAPAIDAGVDLSSFFTTDFDSLAWGTWDMGAFEYSPANSGPGTGDTPSGSSGGGCFIKALY